MMILVTASFHNVLSQIKTFAVVEKEMGHKHNTCIVAAEVGEKACFGAK